MGKSNAERQADYRARHFKAGDSGLERLSVTLSAPSKAQLERLAVCYAVTKRQVIETLLIQAERRLLESLPTAECDQYYDRKLSLPSNGDGVTQ